MTGPWFPWITRAVPIRRPTFRRMVRRGPVRPSRVNEGALDAEPMPRAAEKDSDEAGAKRAQDTTHSEGEREEATQSDAD